VLLNIYEACATETYLRILTGEGTVADCANNHRHLDNSPIDEQDQVSQLQRIPWSVA